jgi:hypothetical protein
MLHVVALALATRSLIVKNQSAETAMVWYDDSDPDAKGRGRQVQVLSPGHSLRITVALEDVLKLRIVRHECPVWEKDYVPISIASYELHEACHIASHLR